MGEPVVQADDASELSGPARATMQPRNPTIEQPDRKGAARQAALPADLVPSLESCCDEACCYLEWLQARKDDGQ